MGSLYALLDVPTGIQALRRNLTGLDFWPSFFLFMVCLLLLAPFTWALWVFDLGATWAWLAPLRDSMLASTPIVERDAAGAVLSGGFFASFLVWGFNLTPTLCEVGFPRLARGIPAVAIMLKLALGFDYVTDWPTCWNAVTKLAFLESWGGIGGDAGVTALRVVFCLVWTLVASMLLQVIVALLLAACVTLVFNMAGQRESARVITINP